MRDTLREVLTAVVTAVKEPAPRPVRTTKALQTLLDDLMTKRYDGSAGATLEDFNVSIRESIKAHQAPEKDTRVVPEIRTTCAGMVRALQAKGFKSNTATHRAVIDQSPQWLDAAAQWDQL